MLTVCPSGVHEIERKIQIHVSLCKIKLLYCNLLLCYSNHSYLAAHLFHLFPVLKNIHVYHTIYESRGICAWTIKMFPCCHYSLAHAQYILFVQHDFKLKLTFNLSYLPLSFYACTHQFDDFLHAFVFLSFKLYRLEPFWRKGHE